MSPRSYQIGKRQDLIDESRQRVLSSARDLLADATSYTDFTINAVAIKADVARATVYYQFGSKTGLLEALCDFLADSGEMSQLASAFIATDPTDSLRSFFGCFARFWSVDRIVMRRLRALSALDPEVHAVISVRDQRRRTGLQVLVARWKEAKLLVIPATEAVELLFTLTSFETFDTLAGKKRSVEEVTPALLNLAQALFV